MSPVNRRQRGGDERPQIIRKPVGFPGMFFNMSFPRKYNNLRRFNAYIIYAFIFKALGVIP